MKITSNRRLGPVLSSCVLFSLLFLAACSAGAGSTEQPNRASGDAPAPRDQSQTVVLTSDERIAGGVVVEAATIATRAGEIVASAVLQVDESRTARIGSIVDGVVNTVPAAVGSRVAAGAQLATIHSHGVHEVWDEYRQALAERRRAASELAYLRDGEARAQRLLAAKAVSAQETERAQKDRKAGEEAVVIAESRVQRAIDEFEHLGIDAREDLTSEAPHAVPVAAPSGGVVLERLVTPGTAVTPGTPLFVVSDLSRLWAIAEVDERKLSGIRSGQAASLVVQAYPNRQFAARVAAVGDVINPETRRVTVRLELSNPDGLLKPQMFATATIEAAAQREVAVVPSPAVQKVDQQAGVFVEGDSGRFAWRAVTLGAERDGHVEVLEGLSGADRVVTRGAFLLKSRLTETGAVE